MRPLLDELMAVQGVIGACIYSPEDGLRENNLPGIFKPERLTAVGQQLVKLYSAGRMYFTDLTDLTLNYDESVVVARELRDSQLLFVICDPGFNHNLLSMSLNLLQGELSSTPQPTAPEPSAPTVATVAEKKPSEDLTPLFDGLQERLVKILGPMAGFIFNEALEKWQETGAVAGSRIEELVASLEQEITDPGKIERYRQMIDPLLQTLKKG